MTRLARFAVYTVFFFSGATALVYQVLWLRWLGLIFGNTTASSAIVLGAFMAGLALGNVLIGRVLHRIERPLRAYALCELGIGAFAVLFPLTSELVEEIFTSMPTAGPLLGRLLVRGSLSFALLVVPTALMGATLPLLTEFFRGQALTATSWRVGLLYAANTFGAALGIVVSSFFYIELFGIRTTTLMAAVTNLLIALVAWRLGSESIARPRDPPPTPMPMLAPAEQLAIVTMAVSGALALATEVLWTRVLESFLGASTYAFASIVVVYLLGIAAGSALTSRVVQRMGRPDRALVVNLLFAAAWSVVAVFLFQQLTRHFDAARDAPLSMSAIIVLYLRVGLLLAPLALSSGACFSLATKVLSGGEPEAHGALIARASMWNTWGAVAGSLLAGFAVAPFFDYLPAVRLIAGLHVVAVVAGLAQLHRAGTLSARWTGGLVAGCAATCVGIATGAQVTQHPFAGTEVAFHEPGLQAVTTVLRGPGQPFASLLLVNGQGMTVKVSDTKVMAHLPMLLHPAPAKTLVICFGMGTTFRSALTHGGDVTVVELVPAVLEAFHFFHPDAAAVVANTRGHMVADDGRNFLETTRERFDVITIDPPPPIDAAGVNNLYSRDFIALAQRRLAEGGVMAHWIPFVHGGGGVDDLSTFEMLIDTFADVFPYVYTLRSRNNVGLHVVGSMTPVDTSLDLIAQRLSSRGVTADLNEYEPVSLDSFSKVELERKPAMARGPLVTDDEPLLEFYLLRTLRRGGTKELGNHLWSAP